jgi:hypothetical protein
MYGAPMMQVQAVQVLQPPPQPEANVSHIANAISLRWSSYGTGAASYIVEVFDYISAASNRFACQAPAENGSSLELCIQGLQPGQSYVACVRSVGHDGLESAPSPWSHAVTLPIMVQAPMPSPVSQPQQPISPNGMPHMPSPANQPQQPVAPQCHDVPHMPSPSDQPQQPVSPHGILNSQKLLETPLEKVENCDTPIACPPPEITGHEDTGLFLD